MKKIIFYSTDFNMCFSFLMYLQSNYNITTTTDIGVLQSVVDSSKFDLIILDADPSDKVEDICKNIKDIHPDTPVILTYVYKNQFKEFDSNIRKYVSSIFYKPFDLNEITSKLSTLMVSDN